MLLKDFSYIYFVVNKLGSRNIIFNPESRDSEKPIPIGSLNALWISAQTLNPHPTHCGMENKYTQTALHLTDHFLWIIFATKGQQDKYYMFKQVKEDKEKTL